MNTAKMIRVSSKGQIVLPKKVREKMLVRPGDYLMVEELSDGGVNIRKRPQTWLEMLTKELRDEVEASGFTEKDLEEAIKEVRRKYPA